MTSLDPVQRFFSISKGILLQMTFVYGSDGLVRQYGRVRQYASVAVDRSLNRLIIVEIDLHRFSVRIGQELMGQFYSGQFSKIQKVCHMISQSARVLSAGS